MLEDARRSRLQGDRGWSMADQDSKWVACRLQRMHDGYAGGRAKDWMVCGSHPLPKPVSLLVVYAS